MAANANLVSATVAVALVAFPVGPPARGQTPTNLPEVRASIEREGAAATVRRLMASGEWKAVLAGMRGGEPGWINIAPLLAKDADGAAAKEEPVPFSPRLVTLGVIVGAGFIATVGPGLDLSGGLGVR